MVIRINPARLPVWRTPNTLQLGLGSDALVLPNMRVEHEKLINLLYRGVADGSLQTISRAVGSSDEETGELLTRLAPALLKDTGPAPAKSQPLSESFVAQAFAEIIRASFSTGTDGQSVLRTRAARIVALASGDKASLVLALGLASAGVGAIACQDDSPVTIEDVGPLGFDPSELGSPRRDALARRLEAGSHPCRLANTNTPPKSLALSVFVAHHLAAPNNYSAVLRGGTAHLSIEFGVEETRVSPLVRPGLTPCLVCRHTEELRLDPEWAAVATQLQFRHERLDDSQSTLLAAGIALESVLSFLDDPRKMHFNGKTIDHRTGLIAPLTWSSDQECECRLAARLE
jgi:hypothetical protein